MTKAAHGNTIRQSKTDRAFGAVITILLLLIVLVTLYPIYFTVIASVSDPYTVVSGGVWLSPKGFSLNSYRSVFQDQRIWTGYANSLKYTILGTLLSLLLTISSAYVMSKKYLLGYHFFSLFFLIAMYFGGGLIPTYLQVKRLGLINRSYTMIFLGAFSVYNMIITRTYFESGIPEELYESARIDGADEFTCFFKIALPLSKAIIAVIALYYAVSSWNGYFSALIYLNKDAYFPLQLVLRNILLVNQNATLGMSEMTGEEAIAAAQLAYQAEAMKYAVIFIASAPLLAAYPFVQKYFVKGVMIGSVKG